jgi:hypothetical protein
MKRFSKHYRNDASIGVDKKAKDYLDEHYLANLKNLNYTNSKMLVVFSGGNAVGKSSISHKIEDELNGLVLENDAIKCTLLKFNPEYSMDDLNRTTWQYTLDLYKRLDEVSPNRLIIRDGVIDWYFDRILPIFEKVGYPLFIIGFDVSRNKAIELIHKRGDTLTVSEERFYELLDEHEIHTRRFRKVYTPDLTLADNSLFDYELVLNKLKNKMNILNH